MLLKSKTQALTKLRAISVLILIHFAVLSQGKVAFSNQANMTDSVHITNDCTVKIELDKRS